MRSLLAAVCTAATVVLAACGGDAGTPPMQATLAGTWNLATVNGLPLPFTVQPANPKVEILSDQLILTAGGTFSQSIQARETSGGLVTTQQIEDGGTYVASGKTASFLFNDGSSGTGTLDGNSLTVTDVGYALVYRKQ